MSNRTPDTHAAGVGARSASGRGLRGQGLVRNVLTNWTWSLIEMASGFVLPRLISDFQGRELLGVWDLGWSLVFWVRWTQLGVSGAVTRYTARYRTLRDWDALNAVVNTSLVWLSLAFIGACVLAAVFATLGARLLHAPSAAATGAAGWVILLLVGGAATQLPVGVFNSLITGYERFVTLNLIRGTRDILVVVVIAALLTTGHSLVVVAAVPLIAEIPTTIAKIWVSQRLCPHLRYSWRYCRWQTAVELGAFGGKTVLRDCLNGGLYHLSNILVAAFLGPASVAVYSRQRSLVMYLTRFVKQYGNVFIPASSALHAAEDKAALRHLLTQSARYAFHVALPAIWLLVILGGPVLDVWMGAGYQAPLVLTILALGHALTIPQVSVYSVLMGMNRHGMLVFFEFAAGLASVGLGLLFLGPLKLGLVGAAIALAAPLALSSGVLLPIYACRVLKIRLVRYVRDVVPGPLLLSLPFALCLAAARALELRSAAWTLAVGLSSGGLVTAGLYWCYVVPAWARELVSINGLRRAFGIVPDVRLASNASVCLRNDHNASR